MIIHDDHSLMMMIHANILRQIIAYYHYQYKLLFPTSIETGVMSYVMISTLRFQQTLLLQIVIVVFQPNLRALQTVCFFIHQGIRERNDKAEESQRQI